MGRCWLMGRLLVLLAVSLLHSARVDALVVEKLELQVDPAHSDRYALAGRYDTLTLEGATDIVLRLGHLEFRVPVASLVARGRQLRHRGSRGEGIASLKINPKKRAFVVKGRDLVLSGLTGPLLVELGTDLGAECTISSLREASRRRGKRPARRTLQLARPADSSACGLVGRPLVSPGTLLAGVSETVTVSVAVAAQPETLRVLEVDGKGRFAGTPLCQLADDGTTGGDLAAGDGIHTCSFVIARPAPTTIRLVVEAMVGGMRFLSPGTALSVAAPLAASDIATFDEIQTAATTLWAQYVAQFGDTVRARMETARALRRVGGVGDASLGPAGASIDIACPGGVRCSMLLPCGASPVGVANLAAVPPMAGQVTISSALRARSGVASLASNCSGSTRRRPKDYRVLIWDPGTLAPTLNPTPFIEGLYRSSTCPGLAVEVSHEGTIASVGRFGSYGTVVIATHGLPGAFATNVEVTAAELERLAGGARPLGLRLVWGQGLFDHLTKKRVWAIDIGASPPGTFGDLGGTIVYGAYCHSASPQGATFQQHGAAAFVGYTGPAELGFLQSSAQSFVRNMLERYQTVGTAVADASPRVGPLTGAVLVAAGDPTLAYLGNASLDPPLARVLPKAQATFTARVEGVDTATSCNFTYRWRNDADHGHLRGGFSGGQDDFESPGTRFLPPSDEATYTAEENDPGLDNLSVDIQPSGSAAGGTDFSRFGTCQGQVIVSGCGDDVKAAEEECDGADDAACPGRCTVDCRCAPLTTTTTTTTLPGGGCTTDDDCPTCQCCNLVSHVCAGATGSAVQQCCNLAGAPPTDITPGVCGSKTPDVCPASATCPPPGHLLGGTYYWCAYCEGSGSILEVVVPSGSVPPISSPTNACTRR
jgi:hypothetical protein